MTSVPTSVIGLLPAAGQGTRLGPLPMSKELFPIGFEPTAAGLRPKVACHYLLEKLGRAGITETLMVLRPGKWDIPAYLGDGSAVGMRLAYLTVPVPFGVPFSLDQAYPFVRHATVALGFPDILFQPQDAYVRLLQRLTTSGADVVLGLFPTDQPEKAGVVDFDDRGQVLGIYEKSAFTHLPYMWAIAVWQPRFTEFLHQFVQGQLRSLLGEAPVLPPPVLPEYTEIPLGDVIQAAIATGLRVQAEPFAEGRCLDIGTPENLAQAVITYSPAPAP